MANFLERGSLKRAAKQLGPLMEPGEVVQDFDICTGGRNDRIDVVLTDRALYAVPGGRLGAAMRLPIGDIASVRYEADNPFWSHLLAIRSWDGGVLHLFAKGRWRPLAQTLKDRVPERVLSEHRVTLYDDGRGATVHRLRTRDTGQFEFTWKADDGVDQSDPDVGRRLDEAMKELIRSLQQQDAGPR